MMNKNQPLFMHTKVYPDDFEVTGNSIYCLGILVAMFLVLLYMPCIVMFASLVVILFVYVIPATHNN